MMERLIPVGRIFFAVALIGLGTEHFIFGDFITGRAPSWPVPVPGKLIWAYLSGAVFIAIGVAVISGKKAREAAILAGCLIFLWALVRQIPIVATDSFLSGEWTNAGKALTLFGGAWAVAAIFPKTRNKPDTPFWKFINSQGAFIILSRFCLGIFMIICGIQHFMFTRFVATLLPGWFPGNAVFWTYFAGTALIVGGIGLFIPQTARLAALLSGLMVFSWVWIVHLPRIFLSETDGIAIFEALAVSGIAFVLAGCMSRKFVDERVCTAPEAQGAGRSIRKY